jgi:hypothetical protein
MAVDGQKSGEGLSPTLPDDSSQPEAGMNPLKISAPQQKQEQHA